MFGRTKTVLAIDGTNERIVLYFWGDCGEPRLRNLARIDARGLVVWLAELPGGAERDCFVRLERRGDVFEAQTYSGHSFRFDADGRPVATELEPA